MPCRPSRNDAEMTFMERQAKLAASTIVREQMSLLGVTAAQRSVKQEAEVFKLQQKEEEGIYFTLTHFTKDEAISG